MPTPPDIYQTGKLRRSTLVSLRWMAIAGQVLALAIVYLVLGFSVPIAACLVFIGLSSLLNIMIVWRAPLDRRVSHSEAGVQLFFDVLQLAALLYLTGGLTNPFSILLLAPVVVGAKTLNIRVLAGLAGSVAGLSLLLMFYHLPLPWRANETLNLPSLYLYGVWTSLAVGMLFTAYYTWSATAQTRRMTEAFTASEAILSHEKKLAALGGLAAAAAHELGTPLATIQVVAKEIARGAAQSPNAAPDLREDAELLLSQAKRCRDILQQLGARGDSGDEVHDRLDLTALIREISDPFKGFGIKIITTLNPPDDGADIPVLRRQQEFVYGLTNIVENAVDFARAEVRVKASWTDTHINIEVLDDGPGFDSNILSRMGEPYISHRPERNKAESQPTIEGGGLGLGVFIAKTLIERLNGSILFANRKGGSGARVLLRWPYKAG